MPLGAEFSEGSWGAAGLWAAQKTGPPATLAQSSGLGNSLEGGGIWLAGGWKGKYWDVAGELRGLRSPEGADLLRLRRFHVTFRSAKGWVASLEKEPIEWGFGLQGGYLLGQAAEPFPRLRVQTPARDLSLWKVPLGRWKGDFFLGRLESKRRIGEASQDPLFREAAVQSNGHIQAPLLSGWRVEAQFGESTEFYANYINLWSGTLNGRGITEGYRFEEYLTAAFGLKDALAEGGLDFGNPNAISQARIRNNALSASAADVGVRVKLDSLARLFRAQDARFYVSRGAKSVNLYFQRFRRRPLYYLAKDVEQDWNNFRHLEFSEIWNRRSRYAAPSPDTPNDAVGFTFRWSSVRLGAEYLDTANRTDQGHRSFEHGVYLDGFYYYGAPLGNAIAGEAVTTTLRGEWDARPGVQFRMLGYWGHRPFRDDLLLWQSAYPGAVPVKDRFFGLQPYLRLDRGQQFLEAGVSWQHHSAVNNVPGQSRDGVRWFLDYGWRWGASPVKPGPQ